MEVSETAFEAQQPLVLRQEQAVWTYRQQRGQRGAMKPKHLKAPLHQLQAEDPPVEKSQEQERGCQRPMQQKVPYGFCQAVKNLLT